ncbi:reverse transcriptase domain-containing protein [Caerostris darwini]|uniref:Reverse transcriptase domain-containing protein n=1 Tax=Caerostris darwini TaxID=1538125 RepID=A0AAV4QZW4_9ARAC|nr:reverse transcriptase domain-containing protein [Caerostris darwini]
MVSASHLSDLWRTIILSLPPPSLLRRVFRRTSPSPAGLSRGVHSVASCLILPLTRYLGRSKVIAPHTRFWCLRTTSADVLRKDLKDTLNLPIEASNEYLYGQRLLGCCGIPIAAEESDINLVDTAFKLLTSRDEICAFEAFSSLVSTFQKRLGRCQTMSPLAPSYLVSTSSNRFSNTWTVARVASRRLGISWSFEELNTIYLLR